jgi:hypothetical protein
MTMRKSSRNFRSHCNFGEFARVKSIFVNGVVSDIATPFLFPPYLLLEKVFSVDNGMERLQEICQV